MDPRLLITDIGYSLAILCSCIIGISVLIKGKEKTLSRIFFFMTMAIVVYSISHIVGINVTNPHLSRNILMWNLANIAIIALATHWVLALLNITHKRKAVLILMYVSGAALLIFYCLFPDTFLLDSVPKMYLPNYYQPGSLYWVMRVYFAVTGFYFMYELIRAFHASTDFVERNRIRYVFWGMIYGFFVGSTALFLVYNIEIDPMWSMFFNLYTIPFAYAILRYELMDIRIIAKKALLYAVSVGVVSLCISALSFSGEWIRIHFPKLPFWPVPLMSACIAVAIAVVVWNKIRESDLLKYEFINIIIHKFRTPLTVIRWSTDALTASSLTEEQVHNVDDIGNAAHSLVELTNTLVALSDSEYSLEKYNLQPLNIVSLVQKSLEKITKQVQEKEIHIDFVHTEDSYTILADQDKFSFVIRTLLDNAVLYTPRGGKVTVSVYKLDRWIVFQVVDTGIGIPPAEIPHIFTKFYRTHEAQGVDTEGVGLGLFMAKSIITRHGGKMSVESYGSGRGSSFSCMLPVVK